MFHAAITHCAVYAERGGLGAARAGSVWVLRTSLSTGADLAWVAFYVGSRGGSAQWRLGVSGISFKDLGHGPGRCRGAHRVCNTSCAPLELAPPLRPVGCGPVSLGLGCLAVCCCDSWSITNVILFVNTNVIEYARHWYPRVVAAKKSPHLRADELDQATSRELTYLGRLMGRCGWLAKSYWDTSLLGDFPYASAWPGERAIYYSNADIWD